MSELNDEIEIDCGASSPTHRPRGPARKPKPTAVPVGKQAPVALNQRPMPPPDEWDRCDVKSMEFGTVEQLREHLIEKLEEALVRARGEWKEGKWDMRSPTWPYTKIGLLLLRCIGIADALADKIGKEPHA